MEWLNVLIEFIIGDLNGEFNLIVLVDYVCFVIVRFWVWYKLFGNWKFLYIEYIIIWFGLKWKFVGVW